MPLVETQSVALCDVRMGLSPAASLGDAALLRLLIQVRLGLVLDEQDIICCRTVALPFVLHNTLLSVIEGGLWLPCVALRMSVYEVLLCPGRREELIFYSYTISVSSARALLVVDRQHMLSQKNKLKLFRVHYFSAAEGTRPAPPTSTQIHFFPASFFFFFLFPSPKGISIRVRRFHCALTDSDTDADASGRWRWRCRWVGRCGR